MLFQIVMKSFAIYHVGIIICILWMLLCIYKDYKFRTIKKISDKIIICFLMISLIILDQISKDIYFQLIYFTVSIANLFILIVITEILKE